mgnify:FL=1
MENIVTDDLVRCLTRLAVIEHKLDFLMTRMRMRMVVQSTMLGPNGQPIPQQTVEGSMLDFYLQEQQQADMDATHDS